MSTINIRQIESNVKAVVDNCNEDNFIYDFHLGYTPYTGCNIYSEKNYFDAGSHKGAVVDDKGVGGFTDTGSVLSSSVSVGAK